MSGRIQARAYRFLRWSERYTKTDMVYLTHGGFWLVFAKVVAVLAGLVLSVAFANLLEPEKYGNYKYVLALISIASTFSLTGMGVAVNQAAARNFEGALRKGFSTALRWSIGTVCIAGVAGLYYLYQGNATLGISLLIGGSLMPFINAWALYDNFLGGTQRFYAKTLYNSLRSCVPVLCLIPALFLTQNPAILVAVYFISNAGVAFFAYADVLRRYQPHDHVDDATLPYSKHLSLMGIVDAIVAQLDRVLVFSQLGGTALAIYAFAEMGPDQVRGFGSVLNSLAFPKMSQRPFDELKRTIPRKALIVLVASVFIMLAYMLSAPYVFELFFPKYLEAIPYTQVYALTILSLPSALFAQAFVSHMKKNELYILRTAPPLIKLVLMLMLLPYYGLWGIIAAILITYVIGGTLQLYLMYRV